MHETSLPNVCMSHMLRMPAVMSLYILCSVVAATAMHLCTLCAVFAHVHVQYFRFIINYVHTLTCA